MDDTVFDRLTDGLHEVSLPVCVREINDSQILKPIFDDNWLDIDVDVVMNLSKRNRLADFTVIYRFGFWKMISRQRDRPALNLTMLCAGLALCYV